MNHQDELFAKVMTFHMIRGYLTATIVDKYDVRSTEVKEYASTLLKEIEADFEFNKKLLD